MLAEFEQALDAGADAVICTHVSNVFGCRAAGGGHRGAVPPKGRALRAWTPPSRRGCCRWTCGELGAAFIAMPGHKGLYGPQGTGLLLCGQRGSSRCWRAAPGSQSLLQAHAGVCCRTGWRRGPTTCRASRDCWRACGSWRRQGMDAHRGPRAAACRARRRSSCAASTAWSCSARGVRPSDRRAVLPARRAATARSWAERLAAQGAAVRAGLHCAPLAHRTAGTLETGTVRVSYVGLQHAGAGGGPLRSRWCGRPVR